LLRHGWGLWVRKFALPSRPPPQRAAKSAFRRLNRLYSLEAFAENLKRLRKEKGYSVRELAKKADVTVVSLYRYENKRGHNGKEIATPSLRVAFAISEALGVTLNELCEEGEK